MAHLACVNLVLSNVHSSVSIHCDQLVWHQCNFNLYTQVRVRTASSNEICRCMTWCSRIITHVKSFTWRFPVTFHTVSIAASTLCVIICHHRTLPCMYFMSWLLARLVAAAASLHTDLLTRINVVPPPHLTASIVHYEDTPAVHVPCKSCFVKVESYLLLYVCWF